jgi:hypothetical protein
MQLLLLELLHLLFLPPSINASTTKGAKSISSGAAISAILIAHSLVDSNIRFSYVLGCNIFISTVSNAY